MSIPGAKCAPTTSIRDPKPLIVLGTALIVCTALVTHTTSINGPWYWKWGWRYLPWRHYWLLALAGVPFAAAQRLASRRWIAIGLLVFCSVQLRFTYVILQDKNLSLHWLAATIRDPILVSYYNDAAAICQDPHWLADYPSLLPLTSLHTRSKPPGPVAYYVIWIHLLHFGDRSATAAGLGLIVLSSLVVPLVYLLARALTTDREVAFIAASIYVLFPGAIFMSHMFDPLYAGFTCLLLLAWSRTLRVNSWMTAFLCGLIGAVAAFGTYTIFALAPVLAMQAFFFDRRERGPAKLLRLTFWVAAGFSIFYVILWSCTAFDPIATFEVAWQNQHALLAAHRADRPYPATIVFDLTDFGLAMGWVGPVIVAMAAFCRRSHRWLITACLLQPVIVAASGVLQSETLRVWNFMLPLMAIVIGLELVTWRPRVRAVAFVSLLIVVLAMGQNLAIF